MRRTLIQTVLPVAFCLVPPLAGAVVAAAIPPAAMRDYLERIRSSPMDWLILALGTVLFVLQTSLAWRALQWRGSGFDERPDRWLSNLHRVVNPPRGQGPAAARLSIAFFSHPNYDTLIECLPTQGPARHPPVRSGAYRDLKYAKTLVADARATG